LAQKLSKKPNKEDKFYPDPVLSNSRNQCLSCEIQNLDESESEDLSSLDNSCEKSPIRELLGNTFEPIPELAEPDSNFPSRKIS
jgi:hypothetical protein